MATMYPSEMTGRSYTLLLSFTLSSTSATTKTLTSNLSEYRHILITQREVVDDHVIASAATTLAFILAPMSYFKSQTSGMTGHYCGGSSGSWNFHTIVCTYVSDTQIKFKQTVTGSRTYYVYGIK